MKKIINKFKRGFTIVELVIVIAVIAILAAVLIPTLSNVLNSAEESADMQTVYHLNLILSSYDTIGEGAETIDEAIEQVGENGYDVTKLTPTSSGDILWDSESNRFLLVSSSGEVLYSDSTTSVTVDSTYNASLYKIVNSESEIDSRYQCKASSSFTMTSSTLAVDSTSIDVSSVASAVNINYTSSNGSKDTVKITANGGTVTINDDDKEDDIDLYGTVTTVNAESVASSSLHVYATVTFTINVTTGHVVLEESSNVNSVYVVDASAVTVEVLSTNKVSIGTSTGATVTVTGNTENVETVTGDATAVSYFAGGFGTENSPYLISTAEQFVNLGKLTTSYWVNNSSYFKLTADINLDDISSSITKSYITSYFHGELDGDGYTIKGLSTSSIYFIGTSTLYDATIKNLNVYQQNGYAITLAYIVNYYRSQMGAVTFSDITITGDKITDVGNNFSSFANFIAGTVTYKNCTNSVDMAASTGVYFGIFTGYALSASGTLTSGTTYTFENNITFDTCINTATITGSHIGFFSGNANQGVFYTVSNADFSDRESAEGYNVKYSAAYVTNCENKGFINATQYCGAFAPTNGTSQAGATNTNATTHQALNATLTESQFKNSGVMRVSNVDISVELNDSNQLIVSSAGTGTYTITYILSVSYPGVGSGYIWAELAVENGVAPYVTTIIDGSADDYAYNGTSYADLTNANTNSTASSTDSYGHSYKLVANSDGSYVIIIGEINAMSGATSYTISNVSNLRYVVSLTQSDTEIGTLIGYVSDLETVAE